MYSVKWQKLKKYIYCNEFIYYIFVGILNLRFYGYMKKLEFHTCMIWLIIKEMEGVRSDALNLSQSIHYCEIIEIRKIVINL